MQVKQGGGSRTYFNIGPLVGGSRSKCFGRERASGRIKHATRISIGLGDFRLVVRLPPNGRVYPVAVARSAAETNSECSDAVGTG